MYLATDEAFERRHLVFENPNTADPATTVPDRHTRAKEGRRLRALVVPTKGKKDVSR